MRPPCLGGLVALPKDMKMPRECVLGLLCENKSMRRIAVYRDGNKMAAQIGPDWVEGIAGFGDTVADALRDLAYSFADHRYELRGNSVGVDVAGEFIEFAALPGENANSALLDVNVFANF